MGETELNQQEGHEPVIHVLERGTVQFEHIDLDPIGGEVIQQRFDELAWVVVVIERAVNQVHPDDAEGLLLKDVLLVPHPNMKHDIAVRAAWGDLKADAHPAMRFIGALEIAGCDRIGEDEKGGAVATLTGETLDQELILVV